MLMQAAPLSLHVLLKPDSAFAVNPLWQRILCNPDFIRKKCFCGKKMICFAVVSVQDAVFSAQKDTFHDGFWVKAFVVFYAFIFNKIKKIFHIVEQLIIGFPSFKRSKP